MPLHGANTTLSQQAVTAAAPSVRLPVPCTTAGDKGRYNLRRRHRQNPGKWPGAGKHLVFSPAGSSVCGWAAACRRGSTSRRRETGKKRWVGLSPSRSAQDFVLGGLHQAASVLCPAEVTGHGGCRAAGAIRGLSWARVALHV